MNSKINTDYQDLDPSLVSAAIASHRATRNRYFTILYWDIANKIGISESLVIEIIQYWCDKNEESDRQVYFHEGYWWTSGKYEYWSEKYPSIGSARTFQRLIQKLEAENYVISGNFLKGKGNNVKFYRVNEISVGLLLLKGQEDPIVPNCLDDADVSNTSSQNGTIIMPNCLDHDAKLASPLYINKIIKKDYFITPPEPGLAPTQEYINREKLEDLLNKEENPDLGWNDDYSNRQNPQNLFSCLEQPEFSHPSERTTSGSIIPQRSFDNIEQSNNNTTSTTCSTTIVEVVSEVIPTTDKTKCDRGSSQDEYADFLEAYKAYKPSNFADHRKISTYQGKQIKALIKECGGDRELALDKFVNALCFVREAKNDWWRKTDKFSLNNFMSKGKIFDMSDKHDCLYTIDIEYRDRVTGKRASRDRNYAHTGEQYFDNEGNELDPASDEARDIKVASDPFLQMLLSAKV
jgi:hypothetical protein